MVCWQDPIPPVDFPTRQLCAFCSGCPETRDLLEYQMCNLELIDSNNYPKIMRSLYRHMMDLLEERQFCYTKRRALE